MNNALPLGVNVKFEKEVSQVENTIEDHSFRALFSDRTRTINIVIMVMNWSVCSFCYYVLGYFIKYLKGNII